MLSTTRTITMALNRANSDYGHYINSCPLGNLKTEVFSSNFTEMFTAIRRHVIHKIHNAFLSAFAVIALGALSIVIRSYTCVSSVT